MEAAESWFISTSGSQWVGVGGDFAPRRHLAMSGDIFDGLH